MKSTPRDKDQAAETLWDTIGRFEDQPIPKVLIPTPGATPVERLIEYLKRPQYWQVDWAQANTVMWDEDTNTNFDVVVTAAIDNDVLIPPPIPEGADSMLDTVTLTLTITQAANLQWMAAQYIEQSDMIENDEDMALLQPEAGEVKLAFHVLESTRKALRVRAAMDDVTMRHCLEAAILHFGEAPHADRMEAYEAVRGDRRAGRHKE